MTLTWILSSIIFIPIGFHIPESYFKCWEVQWAYIYHTKQIYVCDSDLRKFTTYHEIAHYYWYNNLTEKEKNIYTKHHKRAKSYFREYSSKDVKEDFADAYATKILWVYLDSNKLTTELKYRQRLALKFISKYY